MLLRHRKAVFFIEKASRASDRMNSMFFVALLCMSGLVAAYDDGSYKGEGLLESQDYGQYDGHVAYVASPYYAYPYYAGVYHYGGAPIGADGRVVDTPEVAQAKAAHFAAHATAGAPVALTADGKFLQDTPEVALAKSAHFAAKAAATHGAYAYAPAYYNGLVDGKFLPDTPEVAQAKAAHFAAKAAAIHGAYYYY